jgi:SAM-dependent methyltransferase
VGPSEDDDDVDVVTASVASYSEDPARFASCGEHAVAGPFARFAQRLPVGSLVLDAGCGPGRDLARLAALGHLGLGVELNPEFAALASAQGPTIQADLCVLPMTPASVDGVWASASLIHLPVHQVVVALRELARVARPGAPFGLSVKTAGETGWAEDPPLGRRWFSIWTADDFVDALVAAGLEVESATDDGQWLEVLAWR